MRRERRKRVSRSCLDPNLKSTSLFSPPSCHVTQKREVVAPAAINVGRSGNRNTSMLCAVPSVKGCCRGLATFPYLCRCTMASFSSSSRERNDRSGCLIESKNRISCSLQSASARRYCCLDTFRMAQPVSTVIVNIVRDQRRMQELHTLVAPSVAQVGQSHLNFIRVVPVQATRDRYFVRLSETASVI